MSELDLARLAKKAFLDLYPDHTVGISKDSYGYYLKVNVDNTNYVNFEFETVLGVRVIIENVGKIRKGSDK